MVIRGARQVGKTWLVRHFAAASQKQLIELNFEKQPSLQTLFVSNDPKQILLNLSAIFGQEIEPNRCLLFLDEIQAAPPLLSKLRWFAEDCPQLPVIAAGSLLEFVITDHTFSMPVGRINYMHLEPLSFEEFLLAKEKQTLYDFLWSYDLNFDIPAAIHEQLISLFKEYLLVGGLPASIFHWTTQQSLQKIHQIQNDLLATYRDDFAKYRGRISIERLEKVMTAVPKMLGRKFMMRHVNPSIPSPTIKQALDILGKARICHRVWGCSGNGVPMAAELKTNYFKEIFLDVGLCSTALGLNVNQFQAAQEIILINNGSIAEQSVGQLLRTIDPPYLEPSLYYWHREEPGSNAEIDYIIQHGNILVPIEVKAGATGSLKSLHLFMKLKKRSIAIRINSQVPNQTSVKIKDHLEDFVEYHLISIPFYLVGQVHRILDLILSRPISY